MANINKNYLIERFFDDAGPTGMRFGVGANDLGFNNIYDVVQRLKFIDGIRPDTGQPLIRRQVNAPNTLNGPIYGTTKGFNYWYKKLSPDQKEQVKQAGLDAIDTADQVRDSKLRVESKNNGITTLHQAKSISMTVCHENNRSMEAFLHFHKVEQRAAVREDTVEVDTPAGKAKKVVLVTGNIRNAREVYYACQKLNEEIFQIAFGRNIEKRLGVKLDLVNGMLEVPGVTQEQKDSVSSRRKEIKSFLEQHPEYENVKHKDQIAAALTRKAAVPFERSKCYAMWRDEVAIFDNKPFAKPLKLEKADGFFARVYDDYVKGFMKVGGHVLGAGFGYTNKTVGVRDVDLFLSMVGKRSVKEGQRAAIRAVWKETLTGRRGLVQAAVSGYRRGRKPLQKYKRGTAIVIDRKVTLTQEQAEKLRYLAWRRGWKIRHNGVILQSQPDTRRKEQTQQQSPSRY